MGRMKFYGLCGASAVILSVLVCAGTALADPKGLWLAQERACVWVHAAGRCARRPLPPSRKSIRKPPCPGRTRTIPIRPSVTGRLSAQRFCIPWSRMGLGNGRDASTTSTTVKVMPDISSARRANDPGRRLRHRHLRRPEYEPHQITIARARPRRTVWLPRRRETSWAHPQR
jgi:hypothetical protein